MRRVLLLLLTILATAALAGDELLGADVSFLPQMEAVGAVYRDQGQPADAMAILHHHGLNTIRLRLWHSPMDGHNGLSETLVLAQRAKAAGLDLLLDLHYSDTWADPGHQSPPQAWANLEFPALVDSVRAYTANVLRVFADHDVVPKMVQLGNEISPGLLWNQGRVGGDFENPKQWKQLATLLKAARNGALEAFPAGAPPEIMIHLDSGANNGASRWFFDNLQKHQVSFDVIGLSYYPWWHGSLADLEANLHDLALRYGKNLVVVETAYPWTLKWFDHKHNLVGNQNQLLPGYPATAEGQAAFLAAVRSVVRATPKSKGLGVCWWAPEWTLNSSWENLALFDNEGKVLPAMGKLGKVPTR